MSKYKGPALLLFTNFCYMASHTLTKFLSGSIPVSQLMFVRFMFGPLILMPLLMRGVISFNVTSWRLIILRTFFGVTAMFGYFWALKLGDPGKVSLIFQCSSLWVYILAKLMFKETPSIPTKIGVPVALLGLWIVIRPDHVLSITFPDVLSFFASLLNAGVLLSLKALRQDHDTFTIMLANYGLSSVVTGIWMLPEFTIPHTPAIWGLLFGMGFVGFIGNLTMTMGFKYASATVASNLMLLLIPLMYISGILFFGETLDGVSLLGVVIVLGALGVISKYQ